MLEGGGGGQDDFSEEKSSRGQFPPLFGIFNAQPYFCLSRRTRQKWREAVFVQKIANELLHLLCTKRSERCRASTHGERDRETVARPSERKRMRVEAARNFRSDLNYIINDEFVYKLGKLFIAYAFIVYSPLTT